MRKIQEAGKWAAAAAYNPSTWKGSLNNGVSMKNHGDKFYDSKYHIKSIN